MDPNDALQAEAMLRALGHSPFGSPGFGPNFGGLPPQFGMPPSTSYASGGTFFGPQVYSPQHFTFGTGFMGQSMGYGVEQFAQSRGYNYIPPHSNLLDVAQGRLLERGLVGAASNVQGFDENRLGIAIEQGMKRALGFTGPGVAAHANAVASSVFSPLEATGVANYLLPGGTATDFARQMYITGQNIRDYTRSNFKLGLPDDAVYGMTNRLLSYFAPQGMFDPQQTRGLGFRDLGGLAGSLSSFGLLNMSVTDEQVNNLAREGGFNPEELKGGKLAQMRESARSLNVGKQLKDYAEVIGTMREIMGAPDAPIPDILRNLQELTAGNFQEMSPANITNLLDRVREVARASNMSMNVMMEVVKEGSNMARSMGMNGTLGAQVTMDAFAATVASQNVVAGAFDGRLSPNVEANLRTQQNMRLTTSPGARINAQTLRMLDEIDTKNLSGEQLATYNSLRKQASNWSLSEENIASIQDQLSKLGVGTSRSYSNLTSDFNVDEYLKNNPDFLARGRRAQAGEMQGFMGNAARDFYKLVSADPNDSVARSIQSVAASSGKSAEYVASQLGRSIQQTRTGSPAEAAKWLRDNGINITDAEVKAFYQNFEGSALAQTNLSGAGVKDFAGLAQIQGIPRIEADEAAQRRIDVGVQGQRLLRDLNVDSRGGALNQFMGAIMSDQKTLGDALFSAFGFKPDEEIVGKIKAAGGDTLSADYKEMQRLLESGDVAGANKVKQRMANTAKALSGLIGEGSMFGGLHTAKDAKEMMSLFRDNNLSSDSFRLLADSKGSKEDQISTLRRVTKAMAGLTPEMIAKTAASLDPADREAFKARAEVMQFEAATAQSLIEELDSTTDPERRKEIMAKLTGASAQVLSGAGSLFYGASSAYENALSKGSYGNVRSRTELARDAIAASEKFMNMDLSDKEKALEAYTQARAKNQAIGRVFFDEKGNLRTDLVKEMVLKDKTLKTTEDRKKRFDIISKQLEVFHSDMQTMDTPGNMTPEALEDLQEEMRGRDRNSNLFNPNNIVSTEAFDATKRNLIAFGAQGGKYDEEQRIYKNVNLLRSVLSKDLKGLDPEKRAAMIARAASRIRNTLGEHLEGGNLSETLIRTVSGMYSPDRANSILSVLSKISAEGGSEEDIAKALTEEMTKLDELNEDSDEDSKGSGKTATIKIMHNGEEVDELTITVNADDKDKKANEGKEKVKDGTKGE